MKRRIIEPGSLLHGILHSDFDNFLLYRYDELLRIFDDLFQSHTAEESKKVFNFMSSQMQRVQSDNNRIIRDLQISVENERPDEGFISLNRIKLNNLQSVNEKRDCLLRDIAMMLNSPAPQKEQKPYKSIVRARAFCILLLQEQGILTYSGKKALIEAVKRYWPEQSPQKVYLTLNDRLQLSDKSKHPEDFNHALHLFNEITGL